MSDPVWTPVLGDIGTPGSASGLELETAARIAADTALLAAIAAIPPAGVSSVFGRVGAITKQAGDYNFSDLGTHPTDLAGYGITDAYTKTASDARYQTPQTTLAGYGITDAYTKTAADARYQTPQTTLAGYGITDAYTKTASDARYQTPQTTLAGYGVTDAYTKTVSDARFAPIAVPWTTVTGKPTTIAGYSITDFNSLGDARWGQYPDLITSDNTTRADSVVSAGTPSTLGSAYIAWTGTWGISTNQIICVSTTGNNVLVTDCGRLDVDHSASMQLTNNSTNTMGVVFRGVDANNYLSVRLSNGTMKLFKTVAGVDFQLATVSMSVLNSTIYVAHVKVQKSVITVDGFTGSNLNSNLSYTMTAPEAALFVGTFVGLFNSGSTGAQKYTNISTTVAVVGPSAFWPSSIGFNVLGSSTIALTVGGNTGGGALKVWGQFLLGNNNDALLNSTGSGFLHVGSYQGVSLGLGNGTVYLKAVVGGISAPVGPFIQTTGGAPALATSTGVVGQFAWDSGNFYVCVAANTWKRVAVTTF